MLAWAGGIALAAGVLVGVSLALAIAAMNDLGSARDVLLLAGYLTALYTAAHLLGLGGLAAGSLAFGMRPGPRVFVAALIGFYVLLNGLLRFSLAIQLFSVTPFLTAVGAIDAGVVAAVSLLCAAACLASTWRSALGRLGAALLLGVALWVFQIWHERPYVRDLAQAIPPLLAGSPPEAPTPLAPRLESARLVVLGFDGLSWEVLYPLLRNGDLPHFRALLEGAAYGQLATSKFTVSPVIWETISTGQPAEQHGIGYHQHFEFPGMSERVRRLPNFLSLCNAPMGIRRLLSYTTHLAPWRGIPADATDARVARLWEIASRNGISVGVYNWLNTGPTVPVAGFMHAYGATPPLEYPPDLLAGLPALDPPDAANVELPVWVERQLRYERAAYDRFIELAARFQPEFLMFYTHVGDGVNHLGWKGDVVGDGLFFSGFLRGDYVPGRAVTEVNRALDAMLGDLLSRVSPDATIAIVSDHGFGYRGYEHDNGPPGVVIVRGPGLRAGPIAGAGIEDLAPTFLHLLGLPVADDMTGTLLPIAAPGGAFDRQVARVATHGPSQSQSAEAGDGDPAALERLEEYLRSLGYVN